MSTATSSNRLPRPGLMNPLGMAIPGVLAVVDANSRIKQGESAMPAIAKATGTALVQDTIAGLMGPVATGLMLAGTIAVAGSSALINEGKNSVREGYANAYSSSNMSNKKVINSSNAYTMRQRGMTMINNNNEVTRSVLGNEARAYFRNAF